MNGFIIHIYINPYVNGFILKTPWISMAFYMFLHMFFIFNPTVLLPMPTKRIQPKQLRSHRDVREFPSLDFTGEVLRLPTNIVILMNVYYPIYVIL